MKTITLNIPDNMRIGEAIYRAIGYDSPEDVGNDLYVIKDEEIRNLLLKLNELDE